MTKIEVLKELDRRILVCQASIESRIARLKAGVGYPPEAKSTADELVHWTLLVDIYNDVRALCGKLDWWT